MTKAKELIIQTKLNELLSANEKISDAGKNNINKAFQIISEIYDVKKDRGADLVLFNLEVAIIAVKEIGLGPTSAVCALLHGINLKSEYSLDNIKDDFGDSVAEIMDGFNKISGLVTEKLSLQSEAFRTLFLSTS